MESIWIPVVAALGASLLTLLGTGLLEARRRRAEALRAKMESRRAAYLTLVEAINTTLMLSQTLAALIRASSGTAASVGVLLRVRQPVDVHELAWRMTDRIKPILDAQVHVVACGSAAAVSAAQEAVAAALEYLEEATSLTRSQRILKEVVPLRPSREQVERTRLALERAGNAIQSLLALVREEMGEPALPASDDALAVASRWPAKGQ